MHSSTAGIVLAAQKLKSGDICVTTDSHQTKALLEQEEGLTQVIAGRTKVQGRRFTVMVHSVRTNRINTKNQDKALAKLQAQNPQLKGKAKFLRVAWMKRPMKDGKLYGLLLINVETLEEANTLVYEGLVHDHEPKYSEIFHNECNMTQCYKCWAYGFIAMTWRKTQTCVNCEKEQNSGSCQTPNNHRMNYCSN